MRASAIRRRATFPGNSKTGVVGAILASSALIVDVHRGPSDTQLVHVGISNCEDWSGTGCVGQVNLEVLQVATTSPEEVIVKIARRLGGSWQRQVDAATGQVDYTQRLSDFLNVKRASLLCFYLNIFLFKCFPRPNLATPTQQADVRGLCPLPLLLRGQEPRRFGNAFTRSIFGDSKGLKWIKHLRAANLTERQIASYGPALLLQASKLYDPSKQVNLQQAIKQAFKVVNSHEKEIAIVEAYHRQRWPLVASKGLAEPVQSEGRKFKQHTRPLAHLEGVIDGLIERWMGRPLHILIPEYENAALVIAASSTQHRHDNPPSYEEVLAETRRAAESAGQTCSPLEAPDNYADLPPPCGMDAPPPYDPSVYYQSSLQPHSR